MDTPLFPDLSVLVVDDNSYLRRVVRDMLSRVGLRRISEAPDGAEALSLLSEMRPDLVVLDWDLPILSGEEFVRLARTPSTSPAPTVPIVAMISQPQKFVIGRAVAVGVNEILVKPFSPKALWARLDEIINKPRPFVQVGGLVRPAPRGGAPAN
jgi:two-component system, chemotaxis family, chemotaxis protein CheY